MIRAPLACPEASEVERCLLAGPAAGEHELQSALWLSPAGSRWRWRDAYRLVPYYWLEGPFQEGQAILQGVLYRREDMYGGEAPDTRRVWEFKGDEAEEREAGSGAERGGGRGVCWEGWRGGWLGVRHVALGRQGALSRRGIVVTQAERRRRRMMDAG